MRILVADDEALIREVLREILTQLGHDVIAVADGAAALHCMATETVDLVLTDLYMPGVSGWDVIDAAKRQNPGRPVVLLTGWGHTIQDSDRQPRPDAVIAKPVSVTGLKALIAALTMPTS